MRIRISVGSSMKRNTVLEDKRLFVVLAVGAALDDAL